jgi:hypothetical protein
MPVLPASSEMTDASDEVISFSDLKFLFPLALPTIIPFRRKTASAALCAL